MQRHDVIGIKLLRTYLFHIEYWCMSKKLHIYSSLFLYGISITSKKKATLGYQKWVSLQHIFTWFFMVACNVPTSTAARKKFSCASGTVHLKDHSLSGIRWRSGQKACIEFFFNSPTMITDQKMSYFHLPSFAVTSQTLLAFIFPAIGYFHFEVLVFSYSRKVHFMPNLTTCFDFL